MKVFASQRYELGARFSTNSSIGDRFMKFEGRFMNVEGRFMKVEGRFMKVEGRFMNVEGRFMKVEGLFMNVEGRFMNVEGRFMKLDGRFAAFSSLSSACGKSSRGMNSTTPKEMLSSFSAASFEPSYSSWRSPWLTFSSGPC